MHGAVIERCLTQVAERVGDPGEQVYEKLFERAPELRELFVLDTTGAVRGEMLHRAIEAVLDLFGEGHYARGLIATEWVNHQGVGVPAERFHWLFKAMGDAFRDILGEEWGADKQAAWDEVLHRVQCIISELSPP